MQDLKLKKLICLDKPAENNLVSAAPSPTTDGKTETVAVQPAPKKHPSSKHWSAKHCGNYYNNPCSSFNPWTNNSHCFKAKQEI